MASIKIRVQWMYNSGLHPMYDIINKKWEKAKINTVSDKVFKLGRNTEI